MNYSSYLLTDSKKVYDLLTYLITIDIKEITLKE